MADNLEYTPPELYGLETFRCNESGEKDPQGGYIHVKASAKSDYGDAFASYQLSEDYGEFSEPQFLEDGIYQIIGDGSIDPKKMYHVCYAASDANQTVYKVITLYINAHRAELGYMGGGFGIEPPNIDDGYYFNGNIKVPVYDDSGNIVNWRIL